MNLGSLSEITSAGIAKNLTTLSKKGFAAEEALRKHGISLQYLFNLLTQVKIALFSLQRGRSMIKSILQDTNLPFGTDYSYKKPV